MNVNFLTPKCRKEFVEIFGSSETAIEKQRFKVTYDVINLDSLLAHFPGKDTITLEDIYNRGLASPKMPVKILARGEVTSAISVEAHKFSAKAAEKIVQAGGKVTALEKNEAEAPAAAAE